MKLTYKLSYLKNKNNKIVLFQKQHACHGVTVSLKDLCGHMNVNLMI